MLLRLANAHRRRVRPPARMLMWALKSPDFARRAMAIVVCVVVNGDRAGIRRSNAMRLLLSLPSLSLSPVARVENKLWRSTFFAAPASPNRHAGLHLHSVLHIRQRNPALPSRPPLTPDPAR